MARREPMTVWWFNVGFLGVAVAILGMAFWP